MEVTPSPPDDWLRLNQAWWDERAPVHAVSGFYDIAGFLAGHDSLRAFEPDEVGAVRGKRLLHLPRPRPMGRAGGRELHRPCRDQR